MAFPVVESVTPTIIDVAGTAHAIGMPATVNAGDLLLASIGFFTAGTVTVPANWNQLHFTNASDCILANYYKIAVGNEDGTTVDFVSTGNTKAVAHVARISAWHGTTPPEVGTASTGSSTTPDPPTLTPSWGAADTLWLARASVRAIVAFSGYPANYTNGIDDSTGATNAGTLASARRELNAATEDPGTFTKNGTTVWVAQTVAVRPAAAAQTLTGALFTRAPNFPLGVLTLGAAPVPPSPSTGGNRMGGSGAIRKPPRNVGR